MFGGVSGAFRIIQGRSASEGRTLFQRRFLRGLSEIQEAFGAFLGVSGEFMKFQGRCFRDFQGRFRESHGNLRKFQESFQRRFREYLKYLRNKVH